MHRIVILVGLLVVLFLDSRQVVAQNRVTPDPSVSGQQLALTVFLPYQCPDDVTSHRVEPTPTGVRVSYVVAHVDDLLCFSAAAPFIVLEASIGAFAPGQYVAEVVGTFQGAAGISINVPFQVLPRQVATIIPAASVPGLSLLGALVLLVAAVSFGRNQKNLAGARPRTPSRPPRWKD